MALAPGRSGLGAGQGAGSIGPLTARDAALRILAEVHRQPALRIPLDDALGCVLAEPLVSPLDIPAWTNSAMDGYAVRGEDVRGATRDLPRSLSIVEIIPAGAFPVRAVGAGESARIFTGAPLPEGADSVIRQEDTDFSLTTPAGAKDRVKIFNDRDIGVNIRRAGEDIRKGVTVFDPGTELGAAQLGVLASLAVSHPVVYRRPRVGILGSGDEIVDVDRPEEILSGKKIASSNTHTLVALVRLAGGLPVNLGIARDTPESLREHLARRVDCDLVVTTAGISVGEHDYVKAVLEELGADLKFWKLRMRPGAPVGFGLLPGGTPLRGAPIPWIGLPGNPVSTMVTFELFVRPAIRAMMGQPLPFRRTVKARLTEPITLGPKLQHFLRAVVTDGHEPSRQRESSSQPERSEGPTLTNLEARLTGAQGSGLLTSMARANALLIIPEGQHETPEGALADALLLDDPRHLVQPPF